MAILWQQVRSGRRYEVRQAGKSLRLYTDGVFHTQYRPDRVLGGGYWDLLALAALLYPAGSIRRVLVLGVGGGAVIHSLRALVQPRQITGVELDSVHVQVARQWFGLAQRGRTPLLAKQAKGSDPFVCKVDLRISDARTFVKNYRGPRFDLIVEDLYIKRDGEANRAIAMDKSWMTALRRHLARDGMLVSNFSDRREFRQSLPLATWQGIYAMTLPAYENVIGIYVQRRELMMDIPAVLNQLAARDKWTPKQMPRFRLQKVLK